MEEIVSVYGLEFPIRIIYGNHGDGLEYEASCKYLPDLFEYGETYNQVRVLMIESIGISVSEMTIEHLMNLVTEINNDGKKYCNNHLGLDILDAFGIPSDGVTGVSINISVNSVPEIITTRAVDTLSAGRLTTVLSKYKIKRNDND